MRLIIGIVFIVLIACNIKKVNTERNIEIGSLLVSVPGNMRFEKLNGIDSYVTTLISSKNDTFFIEYGKRGVIDDLYEVGPTILPTPEKEKLLKNFGKNPTTEEALFSDYPEEDKQQNIFDLNYYMYDTINSIICKIILPKNTGTGKTGIYVPQLKGGYAFSIYAKNLDSISQKSALQMFKTIRYK